MSYDKNLTTIKVVAYNECGECEESFHFIPIRRDYYFSLSPNPASSSVTVALKEDEGIETYVLSASPTYQIQLWSSLGLVKSVQTDQVNYQLDLSGVAPGFYYVHVIKDGKTYRQQLVVK